MKDFSLISNEILKGLLIKENPSKNERNPGMKDFSLISNEILKGIIYRKIHPKMRNPGMKEFSLSSNEILKGIRIEENPSQNEKSRNEGMLFNF